MGKNGSDYKVRLPERPVPGSPLRVAEEVDITAWSDNSRPAATRNYTGVGINARLYSISRPTPTPSTMTLRGPEEILLDFVEDSRVLGCAVPTQRVLICDDRAVEGEVFRQTTYNTQTKEGATASGINVTDNPSEAVQEAEWEGPSVKWLPPEQSRPAVYKNNQGFYFASPNGDIDGTNDTFTLNPEPSDPTLVVVFLNDVEQTVDVDYTLDGNTITFTTPPACGDAILVYWTDEQSIINQLFPVAVAFCDSPSCGGGTCGSRFSNGCRTFLALYQISGNTQGCVEETLLTGALARYTLTEDKAVILEQVDLLPNVVRPKGLVCIGNEVVIGGAFAMFFTCSSLGTSGCTCDCGGSITAVQASVNTNLNEVVDVAGVLTDKGAVFYALYNTNGVIRSTNRRSWDVVLPDGQFATVGQQNFIEAIGDLVVTAGEGNSLQISRATGESGSWTACDGAGAATDDVIGLAIDLTTISDRTYGLIYTVNANAANTLATIYITNDFGNTWESRNSWNIADFAVGTQTMPAFNQNVLLTAVDASWVYLHFLTTTQRNINFAKDCDWEDITSNEIQYPQNVIALCPNNPRTLIVVEQGLVFADFFTGVAEADISDHTPFFDEIGNGWTLDHGTIGTDGDEAEVTAVGGSGLAVAVTDIDETDVTIRSGVIPLAASTGAGVALRYVDSDNYYRVSIDEAGDTFNIISRIGGVDTVVATTSVTITGGETYEMQVNITDSVIVARLNTETQLIYTAATSFATAESFGIFGEVGDKFNSFLMS